MNLEEQVEGKEEQKEAHQLLNEALIQGGSLLDNCAYLDGCSTVKAFETDKQLKRLKTLPMGIKITFNMGTVMTNQM